MGRNRDAVRNADSKAVGGGWRQRKENRGQKTEGRSQFRIWKYIESRSQNSEGKIQDTRSKMQEMEKQSVSPLLANDYLT